MTFSKETLEATLKTLTVEKAITLIGLAGGSQKFVSLVERLSRNFNVVLPESFKPTIQKASKRWTAVNRHRIVSYNVN